MKTATANLNAAIKSKTASPQIRILMILEHLAMNGPVCLNDIVADLDVSRSSVFRALKTLVEIGWVTKNHGNTVYFVTETYLKISRDRTAFPCILPQLYHLMMHLKAEDKILCDALILTSEGRLQLVETTVRGSKIGQNLPLTSGIAAAATMATLSPVDRLKAAKIALAHALEENQSIRRVEGFGRHLRAIARDGYLWGPQRDSIALPMINQRGHHGTLVLHIAKPTQRNCAYLQEVVVALQKKYMTKKHARLGLFRTYDKDATQHLAA